MSHDMQIKSMEAKLDAAIGIHKQRIFEAAERAKTQQTLVQNEAKHQQTMQQQKEKASLSQKNSSKSGKTAK